IIARETAAQIHGHRSAGEAQVQHRQQRAGEMTEANTGIETGTGNAVDQTIVQTAGAPRHMTPEHGSRAAEGVICLWNPSLQSWQICRAPKYGTVLS
ncbi:MAG: hypothetical protein O6922_07200, partial [Chloroflexi bacterium]|nr:hypothetical protein [Chloroflexota bacterium]